MHVLVRYRVEEFDRWKEAFDEREEIRRERGWQGGSLFTRADSEDRIVLLAEWDSAENAEAYFEDTGFRRAMQDAGVASKPDVTPLKHVEDVGGSESDDEGDDQESNEGKGDDQESNGGNDGEREAA